MNRKHFGYFTFTLGLVVVLVLFFLSPLHAATSLPAPLPADTRNLTDPTYMVVDAGANAVLNEPWLIEGITALMYPCDPVVPHNASSTEFFFQYIRMYQGAQSIMVGWSECGWQPDQILVTEYDSQHSSWTFFPQFSLNDNNATDSATQAYNFQIVYVENGTWQAQIKLQDQNSWQLLSTVQLDMEPSNGTFAEMGMVAYSPTQSWFVIPQTGLTCITTPSSPGIGGGGVHSFWAAYSNRNPPPMYQLSISDYTNMIHLSTVSSAPTLTSTPPATVTPSPTATITETPTSTPTITPTPTTPNTTTPTPTTSVTTTPHTNATAPTPTASPTPTLNETTTPSEAPTQTPDTTLEPITPPTNTVTPEPTTSPTIVPPTPADNPIGVPIPTPTAEQTAQPTQTPEPVEPNATSTPLADPTENPTLTPEPALPTENIEPSRTPTATQMPTQNPTTTTTPLNPTASTINPTEDTTPTQPPTQTPTNPPTPSHTSLNTPQTTSSTANATLSETAILILLALVVSLGLVAAALYGRIKKNAPQKNS
jgi:hypothetical protein